MQSDALLREQPDCSMHAHWAMLQLRLAQPLHVKGYHRGPNGAQYTRPQGRQSSRVNSALVREAAQLRVVHLAHVPKATQTGMVHDTPVYSAAQLRVERSILVPKAVQTSMVHDALVLGAAQV